MPKLLAEKFRELNNNEQETDPIVIARYFQVSGFLNLLATKYFPESNTCYGFVYDLDSNKSGSWETFSLTDLASIQHPELPIPDIERDLFYTEDQRISVLCPELSKEIRKQELEKIQTIKEQKLNNNLER